MYKIRWNIRKHQKTRETSADSNMRLRLQKMFSRRGSITSSRKLQVYLSSPWGSSSFLKCFVDTPQRQAQVELLCSLSPLGQSHRSSTDRARSGDTGCTGPRYDEALRNASCTAASGSIPLQVEQPCTSCGEGARAREFSRAGHQLRRKVHGRKRV